MSYHWLMYLSGLPRSFPVFNDDGLGAAMTHAHSRDSIRQLVEEVKELKAQVSSLTNRLDAVERKRV